MTDERRAELRRIAEQVRAGESNLGEMYDRLGVEETIALLDAADRVVVLEDENDSLRVEVERLKAEIPLNSCEKKYLDKIAAKIGTQHIVIADLKEEAQVREQRIATLEAELAALKGVNQ